MMPDAELLQEFLSGERRRSRRTIRQQDDLNWTIDGARHVRWGTSSEAVEAARLALRATPFGGEIDVYTRDGERVLTTATQGVVAFTDPHLHLDEVDGGFDVYLRDPQDHTYHHDYQASFGSLPGEAAAKVYAWRRAGHTVTVVPELDERKQLRLRISAGE
jgi:hypothetical protein